MRSRTGGLLAALLVLGASGATAAPVAETLAAVRDQRTVELTTTGRRTGKPHTVSVWFVVDGEVIYLNTLDPTRDWVRNAQKTPAVRLDFGGTILAGQLQLVTDPALDARIREALRDKYWMAWVGGAVGKGPKQTFVVRALAPAAP